ncbi:MAG TPA: peroxidase family protein [Pyrinomonadaceae bacterium]|jgi:hypothetical protein
MSKTSFDYKLMLEINTEFIPSDSQLNYLAESMAVEPKEIPAGYTYLGQFIDHDISFDSSSRTPPWEPLPQCVFNQRTPFLNLETIYGFQCPSNPDEPTRAQLLKDGSNTLLRLGDTINDGSVSRVFTDKDLPRKPNSPHAFIVDPRNDENLAVAQTQVAFMRFHNAVVKHLKAQDTPKTFEEARKIVIQHYQWIILKDYLPQIIKKSVLNDVLNEGNNFYFPNPKTPYVPLEFSVAAFRLGHSMIRNSYNWNRIFNDDPSVSNDEKATIYKLIEFTGNGGLGKRTKLLSDWLINWNWFYDVAGSVQNQKFNSALPIDTKFALLLGFLPDNQSITPGNFRRESSLPAFDLYRTRAFGLPTGQEAAKIILGTEQRVLKPEQIANLLPSNLKYMFSKETPLFFYLLAEAEIEEHGQNLGEVGSRIIAETLIELIKLSEYSILADDFKPIPEFSNSKEEFGMAEMLKFIRTVEGFQNFDPLNPLEDEDL